jgi:hypothetical protein
MLAGGPANYPNPQSAIRDARSDDHQTPRSFSAHIYRKSFGAFKLAGMRVNAIGLVDGLKPVLHNYSTGPATDILSHRSSNGLPETPTMKFIYSAFRSIAVLGISLAAAGAVQGGADSQPIHLDAPVGMLKASGTPLSDVLDQIQLNSGDHILVDWGALKQVHVTKELPVTIDLSNLPVNKALPQLLDAVGGSHVKLGYTTDGGAITITTAQELSKAVVTRVYDLHAAIKNDPSREQTLASMSRRLQGLDPLSWHDAGAGGIGTIDNYHDQLIVTQTPEMQARIAAEIKALTPADNSHAK